jgi:hypothetical protein
MGHKLPSVRCGLIAGESTEIDGQPLDPTLEAASIRVAVGEFRGDS